IYSWITNLKLQGKHTAFSFFTLDQDVTTMQQHNLLAQGEAHATAGLSRGKERDKNTFEQIGRDTFSIVAYLNLWFSVISSSRERNVWTRHLSNSLHRIE